MCPTRCLTGIVDNCSLALLCPGIPGQSCLTADRSTSPHRKGMTFASPSALRSSPRVPTPHASTPIEDLVREHGFASVPTLATADADVDAFGTLAVVHGPESTPGQVVTLASAIAQHTGMVAKIRILDGDRSRTITATPTTVRER